MRRELEKRFGTEQVHEAGLRVDTTLDLDLQQTANRPLLDGLAAYERRHGWKGKLENVLAGGMTLDNYKHPDWAIATSPATMCMRWSRACFRLRFMRASATGQEILISAAGLEVDRPAHADALVKPGDIIYVH